MEMLYRQGDVLLMKVKALPDHVQAVEPDARGVVLAEGEVTGHAHTMSAETTTAYRALGMDWIVVDTDTDLTHQEHDTLVIAPGVWRVVHQREYDAGKVRRVID